MARPWYSKLKLALRFRNQFYYVDTVEGGGDKHMSMLRTINIFKNVKLTPNEYPPKINYQFKYGIRRLIHLQSEAQFSTGFLPSTDSPNQLFNKSPMGGFCQKANFPKNFHKSLKFVKDDEKASSEGSDWRAKQQLSHLDVAIFAEAASAAETKQLSPFITDREDYAQAKSETETEKFHCFSRRPAYTDENNRNGSSKKTKYCEYEDLKQFTINFFSGLASTCFAGAILYISIDSVRDEVNYLERLNEDIIRVKSDLFKYVCQTSITELDLLENKNVHHSPTTLNSYRTQIDHLKARNKRQGKSIFFNISKKASNLKNNVNENLKYVDEFLEKIILLNNLTYELVNRGCRIPFRKNIDPDKLEELKDEELKNANYFLFVRGCVFNLMYEKSTPNFCDKKQGFYLYRKGNPEEIYVLVIYDNNRHETLNLTALGKENKEIQEILSYIPWSEDNIKVELDSELIKFITSYCKHTYRISDNLSVSYREKHENNETKNVDIKIKDIDIINDEEQNDSQILLHFYNTQGIIFKKIEEFELSIQSFEKALDQVKNREFLKQEEAMIHSNLGFIHMFIKIKKRTQEEKAQEEKTQKEHNDMALKLSPNEPATLNGMGVFQMSKEKYDRAIFFFTKALDSSPNNAMVLCNRAFAYTQIGKHYLALQDMEQAFRSDHTKIDIVFLYAVTMYNTAVSNSRDRNCISKFFYPSNIISTEQKYSEVIKFIDQIDSFIKDGFVIESKFFPKAARDKFKEVMKESRDYYIPDNCLNNTLPCEEVSRKEP